MEGSEVLHVEICQNIDSTLSIEKIENLIYAEINTLEDIILNTIIYGKDLKNCILQTHIDSIICTSSHGERSHMKIQNATLKFHVYRLTTESAATETMENDGEDLAVSSHWILPTKEFHYLWESLYFDSSIKDYLLHFVETAMIFADHNVDTNIISWNKVVLLHGPPGTGKTSLCKALAQKIIIRLGKRFTHAEFIEINSHSLFSKWFSESGKLVMKLFNEVKNLLENSHALVCILIDEVESLAHARKSCSNGMEPTDSIRVVNALLTQLDQIKQYPNVLILTTSNLSEAIDLAFIDRADIKQYIGHPTHQAIYKIYTSCLKELMRTKLMESEEIYDLSYLKRMGYEETSQTKNSLKLMELSQESLGFSGRILRKIPFLAHAFYLRTKKCTLTRFLRAMHLALKREKEDNTEDVSQVLQHLEF
ncbi:pachytene checkpoint protein 2 [Apis mellifera caucasica]|uniref:Pachytene checkpoint protein 2 homolog n=1 Tax=Apis mellifera TaxID=7460 RepID=A0A7M7MLL1_APIME|nr:pachytene checkpoint protein 2 homolog [Apis mellifera]KAG6802847.1 pachytene checkpoint protein 2 [Apis mellifera caucasica]KAG9431996.1 pachytene checkpoint protein 2 [Apis mellifera carnica]|eukprot:XP_026297831.1 pachytene checkpoint protein 2 homolog [Apis mellifera]